jgi:putative ATP-binding cassette transporter
MQSTDSSNQRFRFDKRLWNQFIEIAQPYFYPIENGGRWVFFWLILIQMLSVVAITFFLVVGFTLAGEFFFPKLFESLAGGFARQIEQLIASPVLYICQGILLLAVLTAVVLRKQLKTRWGQWLLLGFILFLSFAVNGVNVTLSFTFRFIDDALNERNVGEFWKFLFFYGGLVIAAIPILVGYNYFQLKLGLYWREWLTKFILNRYFHNRAYYELDSNAANTEIDNPDQRATEDVDYFTRQILSLLLSLLSSIQTLLSFTLILYSISKVLTFGLIVYALFGTIFTIFVGKKLIGINFSQLRFEANFRYGMVHVRDNAESIAFYRGEGLESRQVLSRFEQVLKNYNLLIIWRSLLGLIQNGYDLFTRIVPYAIVAPLYFRRDVGLGTITQAAVAFGQVLSALSFIVYQMDGISRLAASINRLGAFYETLQDPERKSRASHVGNITTEITPQLGIRNLSLYTPNSEQSLVKDLNLEVQNGDRLLIVGESGCGKSSLLRAIAGLWTNGSGTVQRPDTNQMLFLPQKPYMLLGNLRDQLVYPNNPGDISESEIVKALREVNLEDLPERLGGLDIEKDWPSVLSLGEQQRLAFARVLLTKPRYAILDEATSALDVANERRLYDLLDSMHIEYVSVGHRPSLLDYHQMVLELDTHGGWKASSTGDYRFAAS